MEKKRVLLIDDERDFGTMVKMNLEATGAYEVACEIRGSQAVQTALEFKPDMIFLDIVMPDADGGEVLDSILSQPSLKEVPIVFLTAFVTDKEASAFQGMVGGMPCLAKPITTQKLIETIKRTTHPRRRE